MEDIADKSITMYRPIYCQITGIDTVVRMMSGLSRVQANHNGPSSGSMQSVASSSVGPAKSGQRGQRTAEPDRASLDFALGKYVTCAAFSPDGLTCAVGGSNKQFAVFDVDI